MDTRSVSRLDLTGHKYGFLTVISEAPSSFSPCGTRKRRWNCACDCGNLCVIELGNLRSRQTTSCGCVRIKALSKRSTSHGNCRGGRLTPEYLAWRGMRARCENSNQINYKDYGGRGIKVCQRWESFENFLADMGPKPVGNYSLDRKENDRDYEPGNCRWATKIEQANNKRTSLLIAYCGKSLTLADWSRELGINYKTLKSRLSAGMLVDVAFSTPTKSRQSE